MTLPANIRVNTSAPFPATVKGSGLITVAKANGIWTVGFSATGIGQMPAGVNPTQIQLLLWNAANASWQYATLAQLAANFGQNLTIVTHAMSPYAVLATDTYLLVDTTDGAVEIDLSLAATRNGVPLKIKDYKGNAATDNITIKPQAGETVDSSTNAAPLVLQANYDGVSLTPITAGYVIDP